MTTNLLSALFIVGTTQFAGTDSMLGPRRKPGQAQAVSESYVAMRIPTWSVFTCLTDLNRVMVSRQSELDAFANRRVASD
jgi:hypothetical protein